MTSQYSETELNKLTMPKLKVILRTEKKKVSGKKSELIQRILGNSPIRKSPEIIVSLVDDQEQDDTEDVVVVSAGASESKEEPLHTEAELKVLTVPKLKEIARSMGHKVSGNKSGLINRILTGSSGDGTPVTTVPATPANQVSGTATKPFPKGTKRLMIATKSKKKDITTFGKITQASRPQIILSKSSFAILIPFLVMAKTAIFSIR